VDAGIAILPESVEGDGFVLRRWRPDDAEVLGRAVTESARHLRPWMAWIALEPLTVEQRREWLVERQREWFEGGDVMYGVFAEDEVAGGAGLHRRRGPETLEIGYWIHPSFTRRGLATAVARALTDAAFTVPGIAHVEVHHDKANAASRGIPRGLGFRFVGETPDEATAPSEMGIDCAWRMDREHWQRVPAGG
jgi:ribosomal-protein-serine acetyltransferase